MIFLGHRPECTLLALLKHACARGLFHHRQDFGGFHVQDLGDATLHDQKVGVVDVELDALKQILHGLLRRLVAIDQVLGCATHRHLTRHGNGGIVFKRDGRALLVTVIENDRHRRFRDASLSALVDQVLHIRRPHRAQVGQTQHEANGIQDIALATSIEPSDGIETRIESPNMRAHGVTFEPVDDELLNAHAPRPET